MNLKKILLIPVLISTNTFALDICNDWWSTVPYGSTLKELSTKVCKGGKPIEKYKKYNKCFYLYCGNEAKSLVSVAIKDGLISKEQFSELHYGKGEYDENEVNVKVNELDLVSIEFDQKVDNAKLQSHLDKKDRASQEVNDFGAKIISIQKKERKIAKQSTALVYDEDRLIKKLEPNFKRLNSKLTKAEEGYKATQSAYKAADYQGRRDSAKVKLKSSQRKKEMKGILKKMHIDSLLSLKSKAKELCDLTGVIKEKHIASCYVKNNNFKAYLDKNKDENAKMSEQLKDLDDAFRDSDMLASMLLNDKLGDKFPVLDQSQIENKIDEKMEHLPLGDYIRRKAMEIACSVKNEKFTCSPTAFLNRTSINNTARNIENIKRYRVKKLKYNGEKSTNK